MRIPMITAAEWRSIAPHLPPTGGPGKPRSDDRVVVSAFFYAEATNATLECLPPAYGNPRSLRTRRQRWQADGTLAKLMKAGAPAIKRMKIDYQNRLVDASLDNRQSASEFFGRGAIPRLAHAEPRGRYANRDR
jgi:transposase